MQPLLLVDDQDEEGQTVSTWERLEDAALPQYNNFTPEEIRGVTDGQCGDRVLPRSATGGKWVSTPFVKVRPCCRGTATVRSMTFTSV
jgi:hypothetical protein